MKINSELELNITFLGTGTSDGVPLIGCSCPVCKSKDFRNRRLRSSILIKQAFEGEYHFILIDSSIDMRQQLLSHQVQQLSAIVYTHGHSDHLLGLTEIRPLTRNGSLPLYLDAKTEKEIYHRFDYFFSHNVQQGGGIPDVVLNPHHGLPFYIGGVEWMPLPVNHGSLSIFGYRVGDFAYITDASLIPETTLEKLTGVKCLVINALRKRVHSTHFNFEQAIAMIKKIKPERAYFTHICHEHSHEMIEQEIVAILKNENIIVKPAFDGLKISLCY